MPSCYIIFSKKLNRFYTGATQDSVDVKIAKHNNHFYGNSHFTAKASDWELFLYIECNTFNQALKIEKHIKKMKSAQYIKNLKSYPELVTKLKNL
ncbi:MAG: GIY-YIG nuclease family protein [Bacteroidetes bacterium]|nr:GIY-YIG nuclease family protein [Bacteroidota bacterium]